MTLPTTPSLVVGFVLLVVSAEALVRGASTIARGLGMTPFVVGLTVVAFGTSAPEIAVSVEAALGGRGGVALGNVVGSNVFNVLMVLGLSAVVTPLVVTRRVVRFDVPVMIAVSLLPVLLGFDGAFGRVDGAIFLLSGIGYLGVRLWGDRPRADRGGEADVDEAAGPGTPEETGSWKRWAVAGLGVVGGCAGLVLGADLLVDGASALALTLGISEVVVGLTAVAAGTSLPELATSLVAAFRDERAMAVGNVLGSNIFNVLFVLGAATVAAPGRLPVPTAVLTFDFPIMVTVSLACLPVLVTGLTLSRSEGMVFVAYYAVYLVELFLDASMHEAEALFDMAVLFFVAPLTVALALVFWVGSWQKGRSG